MITLPYKFYFFRILRVSALRWCTLALLIFGLSDCTVEKTNFDLTTDNTPACTTHQMEEWSFVQNSQMGVAGRDPVGERIDIFPVLEDRPYPLGINNWKPYWYWKETLCGTLFHFNSNSTGGNEEDWNNYIIPSSEKRFSSLLTYPLALEKNDLDEFHTCPTEYCMEAQITPDQDFYVNPWFPRVYGDDWDESFLEGEQICTYGPYVGDFRHGGRPEIHPSELYWFRSPPDEFGRTVTTLMLLQDDSDRFDRPSDFELPSPPPDGWRPWSASPRTGEFSLAFEVNIDPTGTEQTLKFDIHEAFESRNVVTSSDENARLDADNSIEHAITYNGQVALQVRELQPNDDDIGVQFEEVCRMDEPITAKTRLQGYVTLTSMVGKDDDGGEGYHILHVQTYRGENANPPVILEPVEVSAIGEIMPETIHPAEVEGRTEILSDLQVSLKGNATVNESDLKIVKVEWVAGDQRQELVFVKAAGSDRKTIARQLITLIQRKIGSYESQATDPAAFQEPSSYELQGVVRDVPISEAVKLELTVESGKVLHLSVPSFSLAPDIITESPWQPSRDPMAWNSMVAAAGGSLEELIPPPDQLHKASQWQLDIAPLYAPLKDGQVYREDDSPVAEFLNAILRWGGTEWLEEFFGSGRPFSVQWFYDAKNLSTGEKVPVNTTGNATSNEVQVQVLQDESIIERLQVTFPEEPENALFELIVIVKVKDTLGNTGEIQHTLWSHILLEQDNNKLVEYIIPAVAVLAGVSPDDLLAAGRLDLPADGSRRIPADPKHRIAAMLRMIAIRAAEDQRISVSELASLIRAAKLFGSQ